MVGDVLVAGLYNQHAVGIQIGQARLRLQVGVLHALGRVVLLNDDIAAAKAVLHVSFYHKSLRDDIVRMILMDHRLSLSSVIHTGDNRELFVCDLHAFGCFLRLLQGLGHNGRHRLTVEADLALCQNGLIVVIYAEAVLAGHIRTGEHGFHPGHLQRLFAVELQDLGMCLPASDQVDMEHSGHHHVARIFQRTGYFAPGVHPLDAGTDDLAGVRHCALQAVRTFFPVQNIPGQFDGLNDLRIAGAPADIAAQTSPDFHPVRVPVCLQNGGCGHHHAGGAVAALNRADFHKATLNHAQTLGADSLNGHDFTAVRFDGRNQAAFFQHTVDQHGASPALSCVAALFRPDQMKLVPQEIRKPHRRGNGPANGFPVDFHFNSYKFYTHNLPRYSGKIPISARDSESPAVRKFRTTVFRYSCLLRDRTMSSGI